MTVRCGKILYGKTAVYTIGQHACLDLEDFFANTLFSPVMDITLWTKCAIKGFPLEDVIYIHFLSFVLLGSCGQRVG